jgi:hypothetical protein
MRYLFGSLCVCALGIIPVVGCSEAAPCQVDGSATTKTNAPTVRVSMGRATTLPRTTERNATGTAFPASV